MPGYRRRKPLVSYEYGTRVYAPSESEPRYRVVATDADRQRVFAKFSSEDAARHRAREIESRLASSVLLPGRANAPTTVGGLIDRYQVSLSSRSTLYAERQEYLLRMWVRPVLGDHALSAWTPSDSEAVLDRARRTLAPSTVQNVGSAMRAPVTFAYKNRWIPRKADPMWLVRYSPTADFQGQAIGSSCGRRSPPTRNATGCSRRSTRLTNPPGRSPCASSTGRGCGGVSSSRCVRSTWTSNRSESSGSTEPSSSPARGWRSRAPRTARTG